ncbi:MAG: Nif11 domain/cupin domain-containing protein [Synechococcus sp.]
MAEADLQRFLHKVQQLNALVSLLECDPGRRDAFAACSDHNQVVQLAKLWGYDIGRRWGEQPALEAPSPAQPDSSALPLGSLRVDPLFRGRPPSMGAEHIRTLHSGETWRLELIHSCAASTPADIWYDQQEHEWLTLLRGSARLQLDDPWQVLDLCVGDGLYLPPHRRHRVERTDPDPGTLWLALYWWEL